MIPFFVGYALLVWYFVAKHRREWLGLGWVVVGVGGLLGLNYLHYKFGRWIAAQSDDGQGIMLPVLQSIMYPYTGLVGLVGLFIVAMPKSYGAGCVRCGYDLTGLDEPNCPECGEIRQPVYRRSGSDRTSLRGSDLPEQRRSAKQEAGDHPEPEHE